MEWLTHLRDHLTKAGHDVGAFGLLVISKNPRQNNYQDKNGTQVNLGEEERQRSERYRLLIPNPKVQILKHSYIHNFLSTSVTTKWKICSSFHVTDQSQNTSTLKILPEITFMLCA